MNQSYSKTVAACYTGYIVQAIVNNFIPLLFLTFQKTYDISMTRITMLITINFMLQLGIDLLSAGVIDRIGYRSSAVAAHAFAAVGLLSLTFLPELTADPFIGLLASVAIYAVGGGLLEVLLSPMVEALPTKNKEKTMSLLHSFYCWGHVGVVLLSTLFFSLFGIENWKIMACIWALVPACNLVAFLKVPLCTLEDQEEEGIPVLSLIKMPLFWILMVAMMCSGASEQAVSQWASTFAEQGLGISKTLGDLAGPMFFAVCMGSSRLLYGIKGEVMDLHKAMTASSILCIISYGMISLSPSPILSLIGCGVCGFSVGIMWPGTFSTASSVLKGGGTAMFAFFALAGDMGCSGGPTFVGLLANHAGGNLKYGIMNAAVFPALLLVGILLIHVLTGKKKESTDLSSDL